MSATAKAIAYKLWSLYKAGVLGGASDPLEVSTINSVVGEDMAISATAPAQAASSQAGQAASFEASDAVAGASVDGAANGGAMLLRAGDAKRLNSGDGNGGDVIVSGGAPIGSGLRGQVKLRTGGASGPVVSIQSGWIPGTSADVESSTLVLRSGGTFIIFSGNSKVLPGFNDQQDWGDASTRFKTYYGSGFFELSQISTPSAPNTNCGRFYTKDVAGTAEWHTLDEAGNETQISPHASDAPAWLYDLEDPMPHVLCDRNHYLGIARWTNFSRLVRLLSTGQAVTSAPGLATTCVHVASFEPRDWHADQAAKQQIHDTGVLDRLRQVKQGLAGRAGILPDQVTTAAAYATGQVPAPKDVRKGVPLWMQARFAALNDPREAAPQGEAKPAPAAGLFARLKGWLGLG